jgi:hypothetical protein
MEAWILIAMLTTGIPRTMPVVAEFTSKERCEAAATALGVTVTAQGWHFVHICSPK